MPPQPTNEQFENEISLHWYRFQESKPVWIEDESRMIGLCKIPDILYLAMGRAPLTFIEKPLNERLELLKRNYITSSIDNAIAATLQLQKRLGGARMQQAINSIRQGDFNTAGEILLEYYDKCYLYSLTQRQGSIHRLSANGLTDEDWARRVSYEQLPSISQ